MEAGRKSSMIADRRKRRETEAAKKAAEEAAMKRLAFEASESAAKEEAARVAEQRKAKAELAYKARVLREDGAEGSAPPAKRQKVEIPSKGMVASISAEKPKKLWGSKLMIGVSPVADKASSDREKGGKYLVRWPEGTALRTLRLANKLGVPSFQNLERKQYFETLWGGTTHRIHGVGYGNPDEFPFHFIGTDKYVGTPVPGFIPGRAELEGRENLVEDLISFVKGGSSSAPLVTETSSANESRVGDITESPSTYMSEGKRDNVVDSAPAAEAGANTGIEVSEEVQGAATSERLYDDLTQSRMEGTAVKGIEDSISAVIPTEGEIIDLDSLPNTSPPNKGIDLEDTDVQMEIVDLDSHIEGREEQTGVPEVQIAMEAEDLEGAAHEQSELGEPLDGTHVTEGTEAVPEPHMQPIEEGVTQPCSLSNQEIILKPVSAPTAEESQRGMNRGSEIEEESLLNDNSTDLGSASCASEGDVLGVEERTGDGSPLGTKEGAPLIGAEVREPCGPMAYALLLGASARESYEPPVIRPGPENTIVPSPTLQHVETPLLSPNFDINSLKDLMKEIIREELAGELSFEAYKEVVSSCSSRSRDNAERLTAIEGAMDSLKAELAKLQEPVPDHRVDSSISLARNEKGQSSVTPSIELSVISVLETKLKELEREIGSLKGMHKDLETDNSIEFDKIDLVLTSTETRLNSLEGLRRLDNKSKAKQHYKDMAAAKLDGFQSCAVTLAVHGCVPSRMLDVPGFSDFLKDKVELATAIDSYNNRASSIVEGTMEKEGRPAEEQPSSSKVTTTEAEEL